MFWGNTNWSFIFFVSGSTPNTDSLIILAEFLWKSSKLTAATAPFQNKLIFIKLKQQKCSFLKYLPLTLLAMALQTSPTKSGTLNNFVVSLFSESLLTSKCQL